MTQYSEAQTALDKDIAFLREAAEFFEHADSMGEDRAFWANVSNARRCREIADRLASPPPCNSGVAEEVGRDLFGRLVREAWVRWAQTQPDPKPSWLVPYDELSEPDKEADRQIGETMFLWSKIHIDGAAALAGSVPGKAEGGAKPFITKEWLERKVALEGDSDPTTGRRLTGTVNLTDIDVAEFERLAVEALPQWAQNEIVRLRAALAAGSVPGKAEGCPSCGGNGVNPEGILRPDGSLADCEICNGRGTVPSTDGSGA